MANTPTGKKIKVAGHIEARSSNSKKKNSKIWRMMLSWMDENGEQQRISKTTGLPEKGNKTRADAMLAEFIAEQEAILNTQPSKPTGGELLFADFMEEWLAYKRKDKKRPIRDNTFGGYQSNAETAIVPYFRTKGITLKDITAEDINDFYDVQLERVTGMTVTKYHANICSALKYATKKGYIPSAEFIMLNVERPIPVDFIGDDYSVAEALELFEIVKGHKLELGVIFGAFYGLRRSEIVGLRWQSIDFDANTITVEHSVTKASIDGKRIISADDMVKSKSSFRTLPLVPAVRGKLLQVKTEQERNRKLCGNSYNKKYLEYIYTDVLGDLIKPDYLTSAFPDFVKKRGLRRIRFHDLRHTCANLLLANGVNMEDIREWLGHSTLVTTEKYYARMAYTSKLASADKMAWINETSLAKGIEEGGV